MRPSMTRHCPLLEHPALTRQLAYAPGPWVLKQCAETGFVYLENPPGYESLKHDFPWEVTHKLEADRRRAREPILYAFSTALKKFRGRYLKRNKVRDLCLSLIQKERLQPVQVLDLGCGWGDLLSEIVQTESAGGGGKSCPTAWKFPPTWHGCLTNYFSV